MRGGLENNRDASGCALLMQRKSVVGMEACACICTDMVQHESVKTSPLAVLVSGLKYLRRTAVHAVVSNNCVHRCAPFRPGVSSVR